MSRLVVLAISAPPLTLIAVWFTRCARQRRCPFCGDTHT